MDDLAQDIRISLIVNFVTFAILGEMINGVRYPMEEKQQLFQQVISAFKTHKFSKKDAQGYLNWIKLYLNFHELKNPTALGQDEVKEFLSYLSEVKSLMPSQQKQAYLALSFFYTNVLHRSIWSKVNFGEQQELNTDIPVAATQPASNEDNSVPQWTQFLQEPYRLIAHVAYLCGLQLEEVLNLRIEDIDLDRRQIRVRDAFGEFSELDISDVLLQPLSLQVRKAQNNFAADQRQGEVHFRNPNKLRQHELTNNPRWYFLFPGTLQFNLSTQKRVRDPLDTQTVLKALDQAKRTGREQRNVMVAPIEKKIASL